jgi:hypothetical protein
MRIAVFARGLEAGCAIVMGVDLINGERSSA